MDHKCGTPILELMCRLTEQYVETRRIVDAGRVINQAVAPNSSSGANSQALDAMARALCRAGFYREAADVTLEVIKSGFSGQDRSELLVLYGEAGIPASGTQEVLCTFAEQGAPVHVYARLAVSLVRDKRLSEAEEVLKAVKPDSLEQDPEFVQGVLRAEEELASASRSLEQDQAERWRTSAAHFKKRAEEAARGGDHVGAEKLKGIAEAFNKLLSDIDR